MYTPIRTTGRSKSITVRAAALAAAALGLVLALPAGAGHAAQPTTAGQRALPHIEIAPPTFNVSLPAALAAGPVTISMAQQNGPWHSFSLARLRKGTTAAAFTATLKTGNFDALGPLVEPYGGTSPGASMIVDLPAGHYVLFDAEQGPKNSVAAATKFFDIAPSAAPHPLTPPAVTAAVTLKNMKIILPAQIASGKVTLRIVNRGPALHMFSTVMIVKGKTFKQVLDYLKQGPNAKGQPPIDPATFGGLGVLTPGKTAYLTQSYAPGTYVAMCFVMDMKKQIPHAAEGMVTQFTVR